MYHETITLGLTGNYCHKPNFWGALVLYVEEVYVVTDSSGNRSPESFRWRKGIIGDLELLKLRK